MSAIPLDRRNRAFIDVETTGLEPVRHEVIEVAVVRESPDGTLLDEWSTKIKPIRLDLADAVALRINGYAANPDLWSPAPEFREVADVLARQLQDCILVGHNVGFDLAFLEEAMRRVGNPTRLPYHKIDTVTLAYEHLVSRGLKSLSLDRIREFLGWSTEGAHTALEDARTARKLYHTLVG